MHLTPRTLAMALAACVAGGLVLGIAGMVSPTSAASPPTPSLATPDAGSTVADLCDAQLALPIT